MLSLRRSTPAPLAVLLLIALSVSAGTGTSLHDGLELARANRAADPACAAAFRRLADAYGTPLYVYDQSTIDRQYRTLVDAFSARFAKLRIFYAVKANTNLSILALLRRHGAGAEVVSGGEIQMARTLGIPGSDIMFTSSSKSPDEIDLALRTGVTINIDSRDELEQVDHAAARLRTVARISFRINPGVDPHTIHQINTGIEDSKFGLHLADGIAFGAYERAAKLGHVRIVGVHCHIGSQITETEGFELTARKMLAFAAELKEKLGIRLEFIDLGGGIGIPYHDGETVMQPADLATALEPIWKAGVAAMGYEPQLWLEPGRFFVAQSGFLVVRVNSVKTTPLHTFVNVDAGFNTLIRPAMYGSYHRVRAIGRDGEPLTVEIAGDVCETGDILASKRDLPRVSAGDLLVILDAGAYGYSMASEYNARPMPAEVLVDGDRARVIRRRGTFTDLLRNMPARRSR